MKRPLLLLVALLLLLGGLPTAATAEAAQPAPVVERYPRIIVKFKPGSATELGVAATHAKRLRQGPDVFAVKAEKNPSAQLAALLADPKVEWAEPDYPMHVLYTSTPSDPDFSDPTGYTGMWSPTVSIAHARSWYLRGFGSVNADAVWPYLESSGTKQYGSLAESSAFPIAVIDTGFYMDHPDRGSNITVGKDMCESYTQSTETLITDYDVTPLDPNAGGNDVFTASHGTCVAGEIAAASDNNQGTIGVAYDPIVRVYKAQGLWTDYDLTAYPGGHQYIFTSIIVDAIYQAVDDGCKIINMSLGSLTPSAYLQEAVNYAHSHGVVVVAASGNKSTDPVMYPAACNYAIGVGSYDISGNSAPNPMYARSAFTSYGTGLDILAPGAGIWGLIKPDYDYDGAATIDRPGYFFWNGTSMASPLVAGGIAALWRFRPSLTNDQIANYVLRSAHDVGPAGYDTGYGWGAFDMNAARLAIVRDYFVPVYRFYRASTGTHFYTANYDEMVSVRDTMAATYHLDGVAYSINSLDPANSVPLYRFYNKKTGTHLYTADESEKAGIEASLSDTYSLDGVAYNVSMTSGVQVHRFYSPSKGVHFYSADPVEIEYVRTNLAAIWQYEGPAYRVAQ